MYGLRNISASSPPTAGSAGAGRDGGCGAKGTAAVPGGGVARRQLEVEESVAVPVGLHRPIAGGEVLLVAVGVGPVEIRVGPVEIGVRPIEIGIGLVVGVEVRLRGVEVWLQRPELEVVLVSVEVRCEGLGLGRRRCGFWGREVRAGVAR